MWPSARDGHSACVIHDRMYIFGGFEDHVRLLNILSRFIFLYLIRLNNFLMNFFILILIHHLGIYVLQGYMKDLFNNLKKRFIFIFKVGDEIPQWRDFHSAANLNNCMYIFGGRFDHIGPQQITENTYDDRLYVFNPRTDLWSLVTAEGQIPSGRRSHSACLFLLNNNFYSSKFCSSSCT